MNLVILSGNLGHDPELRHTNGGTSILTFRVATVERIKRDQAWVEHTEWHSVVVWGRRGEALANVLEKGSHVTVTGQLRTTEFESRDGSKKRKTEINASDVELGPSRGRSTQRQGDYQESQTEDGFNEDADDWS